MNVFCQKSDYDILWYTYIATVHIRDQTWKAFWRNVDVMSQEVAGSSLTEDPRALHSKLACLFKDEWLCAAQQGVWPT